MAELERHDELNRSEGLRNLERLGTGLLGFAIIAMLIAVPTFLVILVVYLLIAFN